MPWTCENSRFPSNCSSTALTCILSVNFYKEYFDGQHGLHGFFGIL